jgi:S1-C subfamily serine protease
MISLSEFSDTMRALVDKTAQRVVAINAGDRDAASGILWRTGLVIAADEALGEEEDVELTMPDGCTATGTLAGRDPSTDIALLRLEGQSATLESFKPAAAVKSGHLAIAVGRGSNGEIAASGIVKECSGSWRSWAGGLIDRRIVLDLALDRRSHGGAVVDAAGDLIGLAAFGPRSRSLVIPAESVDRVAEALAVKGSIARGYLGVVLRPFWRRGGAGAVVVKIEADSPAKRAGIHVGDVLIAWNGEPIRRVHDVFRRLGSDTVGSTVTLELRRANQPTRIEVVVGERPHR